MPDTFWALLLAHLLGDYPLQPNWMVGIKRGWAGLALHVLTHLAALLVLARPSLMLVWPYLLGLSLVHFGIDVVKNLVWQRWPEWITGPYLLDQALHVASIVAIGALIEQATPNATYILPRPWLILGSGLVFVSFAWFITERVVFYRTPDYTKEVISQKWPRMAARAILLLAVVWMGRPAVFSPALPAALALMLPYLSGRYRRRALLTDLLVTGAAAAVVLLAIVF
jgi:hypothetical protein